MMPSSTHGDPQLGIDIHLCLVPFTCPLPSLHLSVVFDPFDYLPFIGATVEIAGMKRTTAGTGGIDIHIPPGFPFAPLFPTWDDEVFMGSSTVVADSDPLTYTALPVLGCQVIGMPSPPRLKKRGLRMRLLPTEVNLAIPKSVYVGGSPIPSLMGMAMRRVFKFGAGRIFAGLGKLAKSRAGKWLGRAFKKGRQKLFKNMKPGFLKCKVLRAEPVNILTGEVSVEQSDFTLPGRIPIEWVRSYASNQRRKGACGVGWETPADGRLEFDLSDGSVIFHYPDEGPAIFSQRPEAVGDEAAVLELMDGALLSDHGDEWRVRTKSDLIYHFPKALADTVETDLEEVPLGRISDLCGNWLEFQRRGNRLTAIRESAERYLRFDYQEGCICTITLYVPATEFTHKFVSYGHDDAGDLTVVRDALENPYTFSYENHHMVQHTNRVGLSFYYEYDKSDEEWRVAHSWGDGGLYDYHFEYLQAIRETRIKDSLGRITTVKSNDMGLPILEIDPLGGRTIFEYDEVGRTTAIINPVNNRIRYEYDSRGNVLRFSQADGSTIAIEVDENNKPIAITDPNCAVWKYDWDARGLLHCQTSPLGSITAYGYDQFGLLNSLTNANEDTTRLEFDAYGTLSTLIDAKGYTTHLQHDELGNLLIHTDPLGRTADYRYDPKCRLIEANLGNDENRHFIYDKEDNLIEYVDEQNQHARFQYSGLSMLSKHWDARGNTVEYHYDTEERLICITNQRGERHEFLRDALDRVIEEMDYWGQVTRYRYDLAGSLKEKVDPLGQVTHYTTDKMGRILRKSFAHPERIGESFVEHFEFDANGNLTCCANEHGQVERRFDLENRLTEERQGDFSISNEYDKLGRRIRRATNTGHVVKYRYDVLSQPVSIQINDEHPIAMQYNAIGQITLEQLCPALERYCRYDKTGRLEEQGVRNEENVLFDTHYGYDLAGNLIRRHDSAQGFDRSRFDQAGQVLEHINPRDNHAQYLHDPMGDQLTTRVITIPSKQVMGGKQIDGAWYREGHHKDVCYRFDRAGNLYWKKDFAKRTDGEALSETHLIWDANQRLVRSERNGVKTRYGYDPLGRRLFKRTGKHEIRFGWDGDALIAESENTISDTPPNRHEVEQRGISSTNVEREYLYRPGSFAPLALIENNSSSRYHNEPNGCPSRIFRTDSELVWLSSYQALGKADIELDKASNHLRMQGQYYDNETGLHYNRYRYYDPEVGQYISQDPIGLEGGINNYKYATNTYDWIDPLGLSCTHIKGRKWRNRQTGQFQSPPTDISDLVHNGRIDFRDIQAFASNHSLTNMWTPSRTFPTGGFRYQVPSTSGTMSIHGHGVNPNAVANFPGSNAATGPTASIRLTPSSGGPTSNFRTDGTWGSFGSNPNAAHIPLDNSPY